MHRSIGSLALLLVALPHPVPVQASIAGTWLTEFDTEIRVVNGVESSGAKRRAQIEFQVSGDSIHGTWQNLGSSAAPDGAPRPLRGILSAGGAHVEMIQPTQLVLRGPDGERDVQAIMNYTLAVHGDSLVGTEQWVSADHSAQGPARPFSATRKKG